MVLLLRPLTYTHTPNEAAASYTCVHDRYVVCKFRFIDAVEVLAPTDGAQRVAVGELGEHSNLVRVLKLCASSHCRRLLGKLLKLLFCCSCGVSMDLNLAYSFLLLAHGRSNDGGRSIPEYWCSLGLVATVLSVIYGTVRYRQLCGATIDCGRQIKMSRQLTATRTRAARI